MISEAPAFLLGEHFSRNRSKKWRYTTLRTTRVVIDVPLTDTISFRDKHGIEWMRLAPCENNRCILTIREGYSWNGATAAPDFCLFLETLVHDVLYQFRHTEHFPFSRLQCDQAFYDLMRLAGFPLAPIYFAAVNVFGGFFQANDGECSKVLAVRV